MHSATVSGLLGSQKSTVSELLVSQNKNIKFLYSKPIPQPNNLAKVAYEDLELVTGNKAPTLNLTQTTGLTCDSVILPFSFILSSHLTNHYF